MLCLVHIGKQTVVYTGNNKVNKVDNGIRERVWDRTGTIIRRNR